MLVCIYPSESDVGPAHGDFIKRNSAARHAETDADPRGLANARTTCRRVENTRTTGESEEAERVLDAIDFIRAAASELQKTSEHMDLKQMARLKGCRKSGRHHVLIKSICLSLQLIHCRRVFFSGPSVSGP